MSAIVSQSQWKNNKKKQFNLNKNSNFKYFFLGCSQINYCKIAKLLKLLKIMLSFSLIVTYLFHS